MIDTENDNICVMKNGENSDGEGMFILESEKLMEKLIGDGYM